MSETASNQESARILLIDDSLISLAVIGDKLEEWGHQVTTADCGHDGLIAFDEQKHDLVISDMMMPDMDGIAVLHELQKCSPNVIVVMLSSYSQLDVVLKAMRLGAFDYVIKDERLDTLQGAIQRAMKQQQLQRENCELLQELHDMNDMLETKVSERTLELERTNRKLTLERAELERALNALNETQSQLVHAEKMASIGVLTAGVAHEINNPLAFLLPNFACLETHCQRLLGDDIEDQVETSREIDELIHECREGLQRIGDIVKELSFFSRRGDSSSRRLNVLRLVESVFKLLSNQVCHVSLRADLEPDVEVCADPGQMRQVFLNLLINAVHAIPENAGGEVTVMATVHGDQVKIAVRDNGVGIKPDDKSRVFDPFFTTKPVGQGTGMGLAITRQLVERMGGEISIESDLGQGTTIFIALPKWSGGLDSIVEELQSRRTTIPPAAERSKILILDDEQSLLNSFRRILSQHYEVVGYRRGALALEWLDKTGSPDVILCDLIMPEMSGIEFYESVCEQHADLAERFVFITGGTVTLEAQRFVESCGLPVIKKPFDMMELVSTVDEISRQNAA